MAPGSVEEPSNGLSRFFISPTQRRLSSTFPVHFASHGALALLCNLTRGQSQDSYNDDEDERHQLGVSENVLDERAPLHIGTVDEDEHTYTNKKN